MLCSDTVEKHCTIIDKILNEESENLNQSTVSPSLMAYLNKLLKLSKYQFSKNKSKKQKQTKCQNTRNNQNETILAYNLQDINNIF